MKYSVKWNNGYWKLFNTEKYEDVGIYLLQTQAVFAAGKLNEKV